MKKQLKMVMPIALALVIGITGCSTNDPMEGLTEASHVANASNPKEATVSIPPKEMLGSGANGESPAIDENVIIDNNVSITLPNVSITLPTDGETTLSKNETFRVLIENTKPDSQFIASIFYSSDNAEESFELETFKSGETLDEKITIPNNIASGEYVLSLENSGKLYTSNIVVK